MLSLPRPVRGLHLLLLLQGLAKVEVPKSNLKTIWQKEEKWVNKEIPSIQLVDTEPTKPAIDIRTMFTKAKSKAPRVPKPREDEATFSEGKYVKVPKRGENNMANCVETKRNAKKKSRKRRSREKEDGGKDEIVALDSSVEILSKDEAGLKSTNTIQESFTKISKKRRHPKKNTENTDDDENCNSEQEEELVPLRRQSSRRAALKNEVTVYEDFVNVEQEINQPALRKSRRERRRNADENKVNDRTVDEEVRNEDRDIAEDYLARKKRKRKKKRARAGRGDDGSDASNDRAEPDSTECHTTPSHSKRRIKMSGKKAKDENLLASNEDVLENQVLNPAQHDIRKLFGSARHSVEHKENFEGIIEANNTEECESNEPSNEVISTEIRCIPNDETKGSSFNLDDKEEIVLVGQKPTVDIRSFFKNSCKKDTSNTRGLKESESCITDASQMNVSSVKDEVEGSQKERNFFDGKQKIAEGFESKCDEGESEIPADRKKKLEFSEEKSRSSCKEIEEVKLGETKDIITLKDGGTKEDSAGESAEDAEQRRVIASLSSNDQMSETPRAVGEMKSIMSYFKPSAKKLNERDSPSRTLNSPPLISKSSTTEQSKINDSDFMNGDIVKKHLLGDGQNERDCEKVMQLNEELQSRPCVGKQEIIEVSLGAETESRRKVDISSEEIPKYSREVEKYVVLIDNIECDRHSETEDQNLEESVENRTLKAHISPTATCTKAKRKRGSTPEVESHTEEEALDECIGVKSESKMKLSKAKRVKINEDGALKDISVVNSKVNCKNVNIKLENLNLGVEKRHVKVNLKKNGELENDKESTNKDRLDLEAMNVTSVCKGVDANIVENLTVETLAMEHRTSNDVISNVGDGVVPDSISHKLCSPDNSSSDEEIDDNVEAICGSEADVNVEIPSDTEDGNVSCYELDDNTGNCESEKDILSNVGDSSKEGRPDSHDVSSKETEQLLSDNNLDAISENATLNEGTEGDETAKVMTGPLDASSQPNHRQDFSVRPKRKRKASSFSHSDELLEQDGRRRSSRVKQKEEQRLEEDRKRKEELEKISRESVEQKSPEVKRRRKSRKIAEDAPDSARKMTSHNEKTRSKTLEMGESKSEGFLENVDLPIPDSTSETKTGNAAEKEEITVIELPQIDEDYINSSLLWTEKYAPSSHDNVIGNTCQVREIFEWLSIWKEKHERFVMKFITGNSQK